MRCLLNTNVISELIKAKNQAVAARAAAYQRRYGGFTFSLVSRYEIVRGLRANPNRRVLTRFNTLTVQSDVLPLDEVIVDIAAGLWADLKRSGQPIGDNDLFIAATALHHGLVLATGNLAHFARIPGLTLDDWTQP